MKNYHRFFIAFILAAAVFFLAGFTFDSSVSFFDFQTDPVSDQVWAVQVEAEPGESGTVNQEFEAASGPYDEEVIEGKEDVFEDSFGIRENEEGEPEVVKGEQYVGDYFWIKQEAGTTKGTTRRYIDISSPWSGAYLHENMTVKGEAEIEETFAMNNLQPGEDSIPSWHDLF